jgi:predicted ribosome quality control (RQC) complex YloA/Tae2 family protein
MKTESLFIEETGKEYAVVIGRNNVENSDIIRSSSQNDTWFHLESFSGPHIILKNNGDDIPKKYFKEIGVLFQKYKTGLPSRYKVIYTTVKNIKLTSKPGTVTTSNTNVLIIK